MMGELMIYRRESRFWEYAVLLVSASEIVIDRPGGSSHPRYERIVYPFDYGHLAGTTGSDGDGIDIWRGSLQDIRVTGVIVTIDIVKRDAELKLLVGCTSDEARFALTTHQSYSQAALLFPRIEDRSQENR
jgi:inorganic pyrophosphatase